jgi:hypothetical protein
MKDIDIIKEINLNSKVGMEGIDYCMDKTESVPFKAVLKKQKKEYENIYDRTSNLLLSYGEKEQEVPPMQKAMSWIGVQMNTISDDSESKIAEILIQGNNMGVVKGTKLLHEDNELDSTVRSILSDFISLQQQNIDSLKRYL